MPKSKKKVPGMRRFMVFCQPHAGDPLWLNPVIELDDSTDPATPIEYTDIRVLEQVVLDLGRDMQRAAGFNAGAKDVLNTFGLTHTEYYARKKAAKLVTSGCISGRGRTTELDHLPEGSH